MRSVELFAGGGGLLLGTSLAGFHHEVAAEWDQWACDTLRENQAAGHPLAQGIRVVQGDVRTLDWSRVEPGIDLVSGGPPCQPFSAGGKGRAANDQRDMFPATVAIIRRLRPKAFIVENVRGLTRPAFGEYFAYIQRQLRHPGIPPLNGESWATHDSRLRADAPTNEGLRYDLTTTVLNAADYGVPQQRHRVVMVGFRADQPVGWDFPKPTHSLARLLWEQYRSGEYWDRNRVPAVERELAYDPKAAARAARIETEPCTLPWRTVREAIVDLPEPTVEGTRRFKNHVLQPGARSYPGHTGSPIDMPAKALKAGGHGVPGGENMALFPNGAIRYFTVRESARLQTFPDDWELHGAWGEAMRQLGNAVPVLLAETVAAAIAAHLARIGDADTESTHEPARAYATTTRTA